MSDAQDKTGAEAPSRDEDAASRGLAPIPDEWPDWDGSPLPASDLLRWGFATGACAAAALTASLLAARGEKPASVALLFGDGKIRRIPLSPALPEFPGFSVVRKNGGDDPDCTHGTLIAARLVPDTPDEVRDERDIVFPAGSATLRLHARCGVGTATRRGLDCEAGHWAVNPGVLRLIAENLVRAGLTQGSWLAELAVPEGEALAPKTLNATLGVRGGISILGTTGLVRPFSHEAYAASVRLAIRCASLSRPAAVLCTGRRTLNGARDWCADPANPAFPEGLPEECFVSMADFLGESLRACVRHGLEKVLVCCMAGKLLKYAAGFDNTHARKSAQNIDLLVAEVRDLFPERADSLEALAREPSIRAVLDFLSPEEQLRLFDRLAALSLPNFLRLCRAVTEDDAPPPAGPPAFAILLTDFTGRPLAFYPDHRFAAKRG